MLRIGVLASGSGTDFQSIVNAVESGEIYGEIVVLISNNIDSPALERARKHGIPAVCLPHKGLTREAHEKDVVVALEKHGVELVVLAGYMRMLTPYIIEKYRWRMINIHPAILPLFGGKGMHGEHVHKAVLDAGCKVSGCTVHFVTEAVDGGPIIAQRCVQVMEDDTPETLAKRVLDAEHKLLPRVVQLIAEGSVKVIDGKRVRVMT